MTRHPQPTRKIVHQFLAERTDDDILRIHYCYQIGSTFTSLALMEQTIIDAMSVCDRVKVANIIQSDQARWEQLIDKRNTLQSSTLGSLIKILSQHAVEEEDLKYLKWVKKRRDYFVHRFFNDNHWPGDLDTDTAEIHSRRLLYLEIIFARATQRIWIIFENAGLMERADLGENGALMFNTGLFEQIESSSS